MENAETANKAMTTIKRDRLDEIQAGDRLVFSHGDTTVGGTAVEVRPVRYGETTVLRRLEVLIESAEWPGFDRDGWPLRVPGREWHYFRAPSEVAAYYETGADGSGPLASARRTVRS